MAHCHSLRKKEALEYIKKACSLPLLPVYCGMDRHIRNRICLLFAYLWIVHAGSDPCNVPVQYSLDQEPGGFWNEQRRYLTTGEGDQEINIP